MSESGTIEYVYCQPYFNLMVYIDYCREETALPMIKDKLLQILKDNNILKENNGKWVSGTKLSGHLDMSRQAINKHVSKLRAEGYRIKASPRKGYCLENEPDVLVPHEIREGLQTRIFGQKRLICHQTIDSTNITARSEAEKKSSEGTLVVADTQTQGRGRRGRDWSSPQGAGIYMSLLLRPIMEPEQAMKITLMTAVAAAEAITTETGLPVRIKWPNDLQVNGRKIAGILTEISTEMDVINYIIVGIGINVNTKQKQFDPELKEIATSLFIEAGREFSRVRLIQAFLVEMERYYNILQTHGFVDILNVWKKLSDTIGKQIDVILINKTFSGVAMDVDKDGRLIVKDNQGVIHHFFSGDVSILD